ncbi:hypothetical protein ES702_01928 [subsurface metagenome]
MLEKILDSWPLLIIFPAIVAVGFYGFFKHAVKHIDGSDDIQTADEAQKGLMSISHHTNLANVKSEVETARGSKASLDDRLSICLANSGAISQGETFPTDPAPIKGQFFYKTDEDKVYIYNGEDWDELAGVAPGFMEFNFPAGSWNYPTSNPAPLDRDVGTNGGMFRHLFDKTTVESILLEPAFELPDNLDIEGTVYFSLYGYAKTADGNEVRFRISLSTKAEGESWDATYSTLDSADKVTDAQQDEIDLIEWNETVANLGLAAQDLIRLMVSRIAIADGTKVDGDYCFLNLKIRIPVT